MADLSDYEWITGDDAGTWLDEFAARCEPVHQQLSQLRKTLSAERSRLAVQQIELRRRAVAKFGELANRMFFTDISLQQSTDLRTAHYKASRLPADVSVVDYCCGIGGDLLAFSQRGTATGWDRAPEMAVFANANLRAMENAFNSVAKIGSVEEQSPVAGQVWHLDPDRRADGRRSTQIEWHSPGPEVVEEWLETCPTGILKLAPATVVPESWAADAELEWITRDRECRQQVVWFGDLAKSPGQHRATTLLRSADLLQGGKSNGPVTYESFVGSPDALAPIAGAIGRYIYDTDPAVRAAGLTGAIAVDQGLAALEKGVSYLTGDQSVDHPLLARFEVLETLPLRTSTLGKHLRTLGIGELEIKKRGVGTSPEQLRKRLKLSGDKSATLLLTRQGTSEIAILAQRNAR